MRPSEDREARRAWIITGRVQGVGFRWFTRQAATALGLRGTVRNAADGSVEVVAEGPADRLAELERRLRQGPRGAVVESIGEATVPDGGLPEPFAIIR